MRIHLERVRMALGLLIAVLILAGTVATLVQAAAVVERGGSRASAALFSAGWLLLVFIPVAWGIFGGRTAWYVEAVGAYDFAGAIPFHLGGGVGALAIVLFIPRSSAEVPGQTLSRMQAVLALVAITVLWVGWLMVMELDLNRFIPTILANSLIIAGSSLVAALVVERLLARRNTSQAAAIGVIAGLAAATACSAFLEPATAAVTGVISGAVAGAIASRKRSDALSLAGVLAITNLAGGTTGLLLIGLLEPTRGFLYTGSFALPVAQGTAVIVCVVYCVLVSVPLALIAGGRRRRARDAGQIASTTR